jgi:beta-glucanase (GH16 family)
LPNSSGGSPGADGGAPDAAGGAPDAAGGAPDADGGAPDAAGGGPNAAGTGPLHAGAGGSIHSGGGAGAGGQEASGSAGALEAGAPGSTNDSFVLRFRDDFDHLDATRWRLMTHSWEGNLALFSTETVSIIDGNLQISIRPAPAGTQDSTGPKSFLGAEVRSIDTLTYGRVRARVKFARGSAVVSAVAGIYTPWPADNWNELDIEQLGKSPSSVQFNTLIYDGPLPAPVVPVTPTQDPLLYSLGFDATTDFHVYAFEWTPQGALFSVDGQVAHTWTKDIDKLTLPQNVLLSIWVSASGAWAGPVTDETALAWARYDWVELYDYSPPQP